MIKEEAMESIEEVMRKHKIELEKENLLLVRDILLEIMKKQSVVPVEDTIDTLTEVTEMVAQLHSTIFELTSTLEMSEMFKKISKMYPTSIVDRFLNGVFGRLLPEKEKRSHRIVKEIVDALLVRW